MKACSKNGPDHFWLEFWADCDTFRELTVNVTEIGDAWLWIRNSEIEN